jgi:phospholipid-binding lipoprotein MlaA
MAGKTLGKWMKSGIAAVLVLGLAGCATTDEYADPRDPWEGYNRWMYAFNDEVDKAIIKPLAKGYKAITPAPIDRGITNFFNNLGEVRSIINNLLQFKLQRAVNDVGRLAVNSTIGLLGFIDVASNMNLPPYDEDFGQTFAVWGVDTGPYIVLPLLGPSTGRDTIGLALDWTVEPVRWMTDSSAARTGLLGLWFIDRRADLLGASKIMEQAALDPYEFMRDAYLQKRLNDVYDGNPPEEMDDEFNGGFEEEKY